MAADAEEGHGHRLGEESHDRQHRGGPTTISWGRVPRSPARKRGCDYRRGRGSAGAPSRRPMGGRGESSRMLTVTLSRRLVGIAPARQR
jgi:hypothetical protein